MASSSPSGIPIICIGRAPPIMLKIMNDLKPEYEAIHGILTEDQGVAELPNLLLDPPQPPPNNENNLGSKNYTRKPAAVVAGGGFDDVAFNKIKDAVKGDVDVVWFRADVSGSAMDGMPPPTEHELFGKMAAAKLKKRLNEVGVGKEGGPEKGFYYW